MTHSVSDRLLFEWHAPHLKCFILSRESIVKHAYTFEINYLANWSEIINQAPFNQVFSEVKGVAHAFPITLIPAELESDFQKGKYIFNQFEEKGTTVKRTVFDDEKLLLWPDPFLLDRLRTPYPKVKTQPLVTLIHGQMGKVSGHRILAYSNANLLTLLTYADGKLQMANSFQFESADELFYFVMLSREQLGTAPEETTLQLLGAETVSFAHLFHKYFYELLETPHINGSENELPMSVQILNECE